MDGSGVPVMESDTPLYSVSTEALDRHDQELRQRAGPSPAELFAAFDRERAAQPSVVAQRAYAGVTQTLFSRMGRFFFPDDMYGAPRKRRRQWPWMVLALLLILLIYYETRWSSLSRMRLWEQQNWQDKTVQDQTWWGGHAAEAKHMELSAAFFTNRGGGLPGLLGRYETVEHFNREAPKCRPILRSEFEYGQAVLFANETTTACFPLKQLVAAMRRFLHERCLFPVGCESVCLSHFIDEPGWEVPCLCVTRENDLVLANPSMRKAEETEDSIKFVVKERVEYIRQLRESQAYTERTVDVPCLLDYFDLRGSPFTRELSTLAEVHDVTHLLMIMRGEFVE